MNTEVKATHMVDEISVLTINRIYICGYAQLDPTLGTTLNLNNTDIQTNLLCRVELEDITQKYGN